jgi:hypothetical protein
MQNPVIEDGDFDMKRIALIAVLLLGQRGRRAADRDIWSSTRGNPRGDAALQADVSACSMLLGAPQNGVPTSREYKNCMLSTAGGSVARCTKARRERSPVICIPIPTIPARCAGAIRRHLANRLLECLVTQNQTGG